MPVEASNIKGLLLLWLVVTTKTGPDDNEYFAALSADTSPNGLRQQLAAKLNLSRATVDYFVNQANNDMYSGTIGTVQDLFHTWVTQGDDGGGDVYSGGDTCPFNIKAITDLA